MRLYKYCVEYCETAIDINSKALFNAQEAANAETKNTAGDKHETGRAIKQLETESLGHRLDNAKAQYQVLQTIDIDHAYTSVKPGALVYTSMGNFFIAVSADEVEIDGEEYCIISAVSPIAQAMNDCSAGSSFTFRGKMIKIFQIL